MKLYWQLIKALFRKFVLRRNTGAVIRDFAEKMGIVYIKLAQMLATQNYGKVFTEEDRRALASICDDCSSISYQEIEAILRAEYGDFEEIFSSVDPEPVGAASVSQVHRGVLKSGEEVAIKVKRQDVTQAMETEIKRIKSLMHRFGWLFKFRNLTGGEHALDLYLEWIRQETDFNHEVSNIELYQEFAQNVNGRLSGAHRIKVPKVYKQYCTDNIVVMEFVKATTVNRLPLNPATKEKVRVAINDYLRLSFWAMFHDQQIIFHGDPHSGNICIDDDGDIWFLDMGLLCVMSSEDAKLCRTLFLAAYAGNAAKLFDLLVGYGEMNEEQQLKFKERCEVCCRQVRGKEVTYYFVDMINVCLEYEFVPPDFLFSMAKAFICLNGINKMTDNQCSAQELLQEQAVEFMLRRSLSDCQEIITSGLRLVPETLLDTLETGPAQALAKAVTKTEIKQKLTNSLANFQEMLELV